MGEDRTQTSRQRVTVAKASEILGITVEAVRGRIKRQTLESERTDKGVFVLLDTDQPSDRSRPDTDQPPSDSATLTSELRDRLRYVEEQLEAERQAHAEARRLLMAALERIPPQLEAPQSSEREGPTSTPAEAPAEAQEGAQRPWWRRWFGA